MQTLMFMGLNVFGFSGLINQSVMALGLTLICITGHEYMKRKRRGKHAAHSDALGSRESWEFG